MMRSLKVTVATMVRTVRENYRVVGMCCGVLLVGRAHLVSDRDNCFDARF